MKLLDAIEILNRTSLADVKAELAEAETTLTQVKTDARKAYLAQIHQSMGRVKLLRRLKVSKEKSGKPLPGRKKGVK